MLRLLKDIIFPEAVSADSGGSVHLPISTARGSDSGAGVYVTRDAMSVSRQASFLLRTTYKMLWVSQSPGCWTRQRSYSPGMELQSASVSVE